jgi:hypothetical protein
MWYTLPDLAQCCISEERLRVHFEKTYASTRQKTSRPKYNDITYLIGRGGRREAASLPKVVFAWLYFKIAHRSDFLLYSLTNLCEASFKPFYIYM